MDRASPLLALRLAGQDHALEPGRVYLLGSAADCDLRLGAAAAPHHLRIEVTPAGARLVDLGSAGGTRHNGARVDSAELAPGDVLHFGDGAGEAIVVPDDGGAAIVPIPALRAAAVARRLGEVRRAAAELRLDGEQTFQQLVAAELRRAPWLGVSLAVHALLLLLAWLLLPSQGASGRTRTTSFVDVEDRLASHEQPVAPPEVVLEPQQETFEPPATSAPPPPSPTPVGDGGAPRERELPTDVARLAVRTKTGAGTVGRGGDLDQLGSGGFRQTIGELRKSGLEVVFVFDSTGSMTGTIHDTKTTITQMLAVLRVLVPDARIGLVTYRDRGEREQYLVRQVPLGLDFFRAANFVQYVTAEGGGDLPEDVRAGLRAAFDQQWRPGARRVVVLAGDAPPHAADVERVLAEVRAFARNGRSFVHALITSPADTTAANAETLAVFQDIAAAGRGTCQRLAARDRVLQRVLTLAFGREFDQDIAAVVRAVEAESQRVDVQALDLARRGGPELARALRANPVPQELWNALVRRPRRAVVGQLVEQLGAPETTSPTRQAIAAALQQIFGLPLPPIDPAAGEVPTPRELARLRTMLVRIPE